MQLLAGSLVALRRRRRARVGRDRILPGADAREDVRGHVQRVRRRGRDARVAARRGQALLRDRRRVVAVDQVVRHARMVGVLGELLLEDRRRLQVGRVGLVGLRLRAGEVERVEDLRLVVGRDSGRRAPRTRWARVSCRVRSGRLAQSS